MSCRKVLQTNTNLHNLFLETLMISSKKVIEFLANKGIYLSPTDENQLSESINEQTKMLTTIFLLEKETCDFKAWWKGLPSKFKNYQ